METRQILISLMLTDFGISLYPKSDGRVEIPKYIVKNIGFVSSNMVYMSSDMCGNIYISTNSELLEDEISISVAISNGRLRIPSKFLKKIGLINKSLVIVSDSHSILHLKADNSHNEEALELLLNELDDDKTSRLLDILSGKRVDNNYILNMDIVRVSTNQTKLPKAKLFLLEGNEDKTFAFRPIGNPYKFRCCWVNRVPKLTKDANNSVILYAIPGINRMKSGDNSSGFLIIDQITFGKICYVVNKKNSTTAIGKDLIFIFSPKTKIGSFKVFENPNTDIDNKIIEEAKLICANPEKFLSNKFSFFESGKCDLPPTTITLNTIGNINKE